MPKYYYEVVESGTQPDVQAISKDKFPKRSELKDGVKFAPEGDEKMTILELGLFHWLAHQHEAGQRTVCKVDGKKIKGWHLSKQNDPYDDVAAAAFQPGKGK